MPETTSSNPFPITGRDGRFLFLCAFIRDRRLILVSTYYPDLLLDFREVEVEVDGQRLDCFEEIGLNGFEPTRAVVYPLRELRPNHEVTVRYRGEHQTYTISTDLPADHKRFAVATLFKDDHRVVETFVRYYREQGVERFYLFYNGDLQTIQQFLPAGDDIVYGSWDLPYKIDRARAASLDRMIDPTASRTWHHGQTAFLTMVRHRYLDDCSYLALVDLDEYLHVPGATLRAHVERMDAETLTVRSHWAEVRRPDRWTPDCLSKSRFFRLATALGHRMRGLVRRRLFGARDLPMLAYEDLGMIWANARNEGAKQAKTIYRGDYPGLWGVHEPKHDKPIAYSETIRLIHLANGTKGNRSHRIHHDAVPIALVDVPGSTPCPQ